MRQWSIGKQKPLAFGVPMVPNEHGKNVTFAHVLLLDSMSKNKHKIQYPNLPCAIRLIPYNPDVPIPLLPRDLETVGDSVSEESLSDSQLT